MREAVRRTPRAAALAAVLMAVPASSAAAQSAAPSTTTSSDATATTATASDAAPLKLTRAETKSLQRRLRVRADGSLGPRTRSAIRRKEKALGLRVDGRPDALLLRDLKLGPPKSARVAPTTAVPPSAPTDGIAPTTTPTTPAAPTPAATGTAASTTGAGAAAVAAARAQIGTPYQSAGTAPGGFDCSGLVLWSFAQAGIALPRTSFDQFSAGVAVTKDQVQAGDIVFFDTAGPGASHDGIATSPTTAISSTTRGVMEHSIVDDYWGAHFVGARRVG